MQELVQSQDWRRSCEVAVLLTCARAGDVRLDGLLDQRGDAPEPPHTETDLSGGRDGLIVRVVVVHYLQKAPGRAPVVRQ